MTVKVVLWSVLGALVLLIVAGAGWMASLPPASGAAVLPPMPRQETDAMLAALKPPKRERPLIAVIGINEATETTDYLMPAAILRQADVADVVMLSTGPGPVTLYPALTVEADATIAQFDEEHPDGADYVIVPAMSRDDDPAVLAWLRDQAAGGAMIIGVCAGATIVAAAGLLDGRRATTHWYYLDALLEEHPTVEHAADRRLVVDRGVATTTGISASMPMSLTLVEAIAGRGRAEAVAKELGLDTWDTRHDSGAFQFTRAFASTAIGNCLRFWKREQLGLELLPGMDELSLALVADSWSRTYRSGVTTFTPSGDAVTGRNGIRIVPDAAAANWPGERLLPPVEELLPVEALDGALRRIGERYGARTADFVAMQLEYPRRPAGSFRVESGRTGHTGPRGDRPVSVSSSL